MLQPVLVRQKSSAQNRLHSKRPEKIRGDEAAPKLSRKLASVYDEGSRNPRREIAHRFRPLSPIDKIRRRNVIQRALRINTPDKDQFVRSRITDRMQQQSIEYAEHHRVRADPQPENQNDRDRNQRRSQQHARAESNIVEKRFHYGKTLQI